MFFCLFKSLPHLPAVENPSEEEFLCVAGVLLSIVVKPGAERPGFLLLLDAATLTEVARAEVDTIFPVTLHGMYCDPKPDTG